MCTGNRTEGSNPSLSARKSMQAKLDHVVLWVTDPLADRIVLARRGRASFARPLIRIGPAGGARQRRQADRQSLSHFHRKSTCLDCSCPMASHYHAGMRAHVRACARVQGSAISSAASTATPPPSEARIAALSLRYRCAIAGRSPAWVAGIARAKKDIWAGTGFARSAAGRWSTSSAITRLENP